MGSLHHIDFGVFWASWGRSGKEPGSGNRFRELVLVPGNRVPDPRHCQGSGFRRFRARGLESFGVRWASFGSVPELWTELVLGTRGIKKVPGSGDSVPEVPRKLLCTLKDLWKYTFALGTYTFVLWTYTFVLRTCTFVLWTYTFVLWPYTFVL